MICWRTGLAARPSRAWLLLLLLLLAAPIPLGAGQQPPSIEESAAEPVKYVGDVQTDPRFYDGAIRHAVGAHRYQVVRANRAHPWEDGGDVGWTYNHQPFLAYWKDRFYLSYVSNLFEEHNPPGRTLLAVSEDGRSWSRPRVLFPEYALPEIHRGEVHIPAGTPSVMHMAGLARPPELIYADIEVVPIALTDTGIRRLVSAIAGNFERPEGEDAVPVSRGLYADSNFYNATGSFHLFNTCNTWTARMLRNSGVDLSPSGVITADDLMTRLRNAIDADLRSRGGA